MSEERLQQLEADITALKALLRRSGITILDGGAIAGHGRYRLIDFLNAAITDRGGHIEVDVTGGPGSFHSILSARHTDTLAAVVSRGSVIVGNSTPDWAELVLGAAATYLRSDGSDLLFSAILDADLPATIARDSELHAQSHGSADHTGKIGEVPWGPLRITLSKALPAATNNATLDDDWVYKSPWTNEVVRISRWYIRFEGNLAVAATFELRKNGTLITEASITVALGARDAAIDAFTETTLADGDSLEVWQTAGNAEDIGGSAYVYGDQDVVDVVTY